MNPLRPTLGCALLFFLGCRGVPSAAIATSNPAAQKTREELVAETNAMVDIVSARVSERDLAASIASEHVAILAHRAAKLGERCDHLSTHDRATLEPHLDWLAQVHNTVTLSIGILRNESRSLDEGQAEVLLWTKVFVKEIESLERRVDRIAPVNVLLTQRSRK